MHHDALYLIHVKKHYKQIVFDHLHLLHLKNKDHLRRKKTNNNKTHYKNNFKINHYNLVQIDDLIHEHHIDHLYLYAKSNIFLHKVHLLVHYMKVLMNHHVVLELFLLYQKLEKHQVQPTEHELYVIVPYLKKNNSRILFFIYISSFFTPYICCITLIPSLINRLCLSYCKCT